MKAMILAAGFGKRLQPLTDHLAKPAIHFMGTPLMSFPLLHLETLGLDRLVINLHHLPDTVIKAAHDLTLNQDYQLIFSHEEPVILDSGGGLDQAKSNLVGDGNFATINADQILLTDEANIAKAFARHKEQQALMTFVTCNMPGLGDTLSGLWRDAEGNYVGYGKTAPRASSTPEHYTGLAFFNDRVFEYIPEGRPSHILIDVATKALTAGERILLAHIEDAEFFETGNPQDLKAAEQTCQSYLDSPTDCFQKRSLEKTFARFLG